MGTNLQVLKGAEMAVEMIVNPMAVTEYAAAYKRLAELRTELVTCEQKVEQLQDKNVTWRTQGKSRIHAKALARLSGHGDKFEDGALASSELETMQMDIAVLREAVAIQEQMVRLEHMRASEIVVKSVTPHLKKLVARTVESLEQLKTAIIAEREFSRLLQENDVRNVPHIAFVGVGDPTQHESNRIDLYINDMKENGYF